jgi:hypothetical protein
VERTIKIISGTVEVTGTLSDCPTATAIWNVLPIKSTADTWGDEIYFTIPVQVELDDTAREVVEKGDLGFWPSGPAFCIFFGPTPASRGAEIRPASAVNVFGRIAGDVAVLRKIRSGSAILVERASG